MNLSEEATSYAMDRATTPAQMPALSRAFMAGALAALTSKAPAEQLRAECVQYGRAIGTPAERARLLAMGVRTEKPGEAAPDQGDPQTDQQGPRDNT